MGGRYIPVAVDKRCHHVPGPHSQLNSAADLYTDDEREFLVAVDRFKREHNKPFPTLCEILEVARSLGWVKVAPPASESPHA